MDGPFKSVSEDFQSPDIRGLFTGFFTLGLIGFGGVLPLARRMVVETRGWLTADEFSDLLGLCQFLPGGNIINMSVAIGLRFRGVAGALAALLGLIAAPTVIVICLGVVYDQYHDNIYVEHAFAGLAAAAAGLLISMAFKIVKPLARKPYAMAIATLCFLAIAVLHFSLVTTMVVLSPISILVTWRLRA